MERMLRPKELSAVLKSSTILKASEILKSQNRLWTLEQGPDFLQKPDFICISASGAEICINIADMRSAVEYSYILGIRLIEIFCGDKVVDLELIG